MKVYKLVSKYNMEKILENNSLFLHENYSSSYSVEYMEKNFYEYNEELTDLLKSYSPEKEELTKCLALSLYFDEANPWVEKFFFLGADINENMIKCAFCHYPPYALKNCQFLLSHGYNLKKENNKIINFLLQNCSYNDIHNIELWKFFIENGLDLNLEGNENPFSDFINMISDNEDLIHLLVESGFDINKKNRGTSFIDLICNWTTNEKIIMYLVSLEEPDTPVFKQLETDLNLTAENIMNNNNNVVLDRENNVVFKNLYIDSNSFLGTKWFLRNNKCVHVSKVVNYSEYGAKFFYKQIYITTNLLGNPLQLDEKSYVWNFTDKDNNDICFSIVIMDSDELVFTIQFGHINY